MLNLDTHHMLIRISLLLILITSIETLPKNKQGPFKHSTQYVEIPETSIISQQLGLVLQEDQFMALDANNRMFSVFLKLNKPSTIHGRMQQCGGTELIDHETMAINKTITDYTTIFEQLLKISAGHYAPNSSNTSKSVNKRSILGFFNLGLNIITSAISGINQYRLNRHFNDLRSDFISFAEKVDKINANNVLIHRRFVKILKNMETNLVSYIDNLDCQLDSKLARALQHLKTIEYLSKLEKALEPLEHGTLTGKLTPHIVPYNALTKILSDHPELNNTLYSDMSPAFFYKAASLIIVDMIHSADSLTIHYVLTVPYLTFYNTFKSYRIRQIGISLPQSNSNLNSQCVMAKLPGVVVQSGGKFFSIENTICTDSQIKYCYSQPVYHLPEVTCLTNYSTCEFFPVSCSPSYIFDKTGLLVRHKKAIFALERSVSPNIHTISPNDLSISYLPWHTYSLVRFESQTLYSPTFISTSIELAAPDLEFDHSNIRYNKTVYADVSSLIETNANVEFSLKTSKTSLTLTYVLLGLTAIVIMSTMIIFYILHRFKQSLRNPNELQSPQPSISNDIPIILTS